MTKSTALEIIRSFSHEDINRFDSFLRSPYFNTNSNVIRLFDVIKLHAPDYSDPGLEKDNLWKKLFPEKKYNYGTMKNLIFEIKKLAAKFVTIEELSDNSIEEQTILVRTLGKRNIPRYFISKINEIEKEYRSGKLNKLNTDIEDFFANMFRIKFMKHAYLRVYNPKLAKDEDLKTYIALMVGSFLTYTTMFYNNTIVQSIDNNFRPVNKILDPLVNLMLESEGEAMISELSEYMPKAAEFAGLNLLSLKLLGGKASEEDFLEFRNVVYKSADSLSPLDLKGFLTRLINSANSLNSPRISVATERIDALKLRMKKKLLTHGDGKFYLLELLQFFWSAGNLNDFVVIEKLIRDYVSRSQDEKKENIMLCGKIFFNIRDGKHNEALALTSQVIPESFMMKVNLRMIRARCLYMINDYETFIYERDSLNHFLRNSKSLNEIKIIQLKDFFDKVNRMFRLRNNFDKHELSRLKEEIISNVNYPVWMKEELERF